MSKAIEIAISGAGTNGAAEAGAVAALEDLGYPVRFSVGTSAGSIVAALVALGVPGRQMKQIILAADYAKLIDYQPWMIPFRWSLASAANVQAWLREITDGQQMRDCQIPLTTVSADLVEQRPVYWRSAQVPEMPVWQAVYSSMAIPYVFPKWLDRYVDGGTMDNLPVAELPGRGKRLALLATETSGTGPVQGPMDEAGRILSMLLSANVDQAKVYARAMGVPVVALPCDNLGFLDRHQTRNEKLGLWQAGYQAVMRLMESQEGKAWAAQ